MPHTLRFRLRRRSVTSSVNFSSIHLHFRASKTSLAGILIGAGCLSGCSPTINLATPEPVKVDVAVRLDVYQKTAPTKAKEEQSSLEIAANRRLRSGQIQQLKNDGVVGEDRDGYLDMSMKKPPTDPKYLAYAQGIVSAENADRSYLYLTNAQTQNKPLELVEREYAQLWSDRAFPGEWIQKENGTWIQK
jgi:uncharacterized protein YdbL (DUF1318 family)